jgi:DNA-binding MarR family transcriptional regulator
MMAHEIYTDVCFLTEHDENLWWYDGERIEFRSPNYSKLLMLMMSEPVLTLADMQNHLKINMSAVKKLVNQLTDKHYIERGSSDGSWRVFITPSV